MKDRMRKGRLQLLVGAALEVGRWADLAVKEGDLNGPLRGSVSFCA